MNAKDFLSGYKRGLKRLDNLKAKQAELRTIAESAGGVELATVDGERVIVPKASGGKSDRLDRLIVDMIAMQDSIERERERVYYSFKAITDIIDSIENEDIKAALYAYYITGMTWEQAADWEEQSQSTTYRNRKKGLEIIDKMLDSE